MRFVAACVDGALLSALSFAVELAFVAAGWSLTPFEFQSVYVVLYLALGFPYYVWIQERWGGTPGKLLVRVRVVDSRAAEEGRLEPAGFTSLTWRYLAYALSYLPLGAGYLMAAFHPRKQALHELVSATCSVRGRA